MSELDLRVHHIQDLRLLMDFSTPEEVVRNQLSALNVLKAAKNPRGYDNYYVEDMVGTHPAQESSWMTHQVDALNTLQAAPDETKVHLIKSGMDDICQAAVVGRHCLLISPGREWYLAFKLHEEIMRLDSSHEFTLIPKNEDAQLAAITTLGVLRLFVSTFSTFGLMKQWMNEVRGMWWESTQGSEGDILSEMQALMK